MPAPYLLPLLLVGTAGLSGVGFWLFQRFTAAEVKQNAADIDANGSQDNLRKGYHQRRGWVRFWPWLGCTVLGSFAMSFASLISFLLSFAALGLLLAGYFARYFTPMLNVARGLPEWRASSDSASWPDAAAWKVTRAKYSSSAALSLGYTEQVYANAYVRVLLARTWLYCRLGALVLAVGAVVVALLTNS